MDDEILKRRDRSAEFAVLRRAAQRQAQWLQNTGPTEHVNPDCTAESQPPKLVPPPWVRVLSHCDELEGTIRKKIAALEEMQQAHLQPRFSSFAEDDSELAEEEAGLRIEKSGTDVQKLLKELDRMVKTGVRPADPNNGDEVIAAQNVQRHLSTRLTGVVGAFKDSQQLYADRLRKRTAKAREFRHIGSSETHERLEREEKTAQLQAQGYTQADIQELLLEEDRQNQLSSEVQDILHHIQELHEMFSDLRDMIVEQGTMLDRIDYNIQATRDQMTKGLVELRAASEQQKKCVVA